MKPLDGLLVVEFCQFLAGPSAGLKLADLGARVIKVERPGKGESGRQIAIKNLFVEGDSLVFHTINRNKESYAANLKDPEDLKRVRKLIAQADVMTHNFRPGVMDKIGLDYASVQKINSKIIYGVVTGYGDKGPWAAKPGQDLLIQSLSGLTYLSGPKSSGPMPFGLAIADMICGAHLAQGILAGLIKRGKTHEGSLVEVSLMESILDLQFELLTTYLNDGGKLPQRGKAKGSAHAYLRAPYGVYQTKDAYLALAMGNLCELGKAIGWEDMEAYQNQASWFDKRDEIVEILAGYIKQKTTAEWLSILEPSGIWCSPVLNYQEVLQHEGFRVLGMAQKVALPNGASLTTTRCPIRINQQKLYATKPAPKAGADTDQLNGEFKLTEWKEKD